MLAQKGCVELIHLSKWVLGGGGHPGWPKEFWWRNSLSIRILTLPWAVAVRIPSQNINISNICNVRMMSEWYRKELLFQSPMYGRTYPCHNPVDGLGASHPPRIHFDTTENWEHKEHVVIRWYATDYATEEQTRAFK